MERKTVFHVRKRSLLAIAGCVWIIAGFNVARLGVIAYRQIAPFSAVHMLISLIVFAAFGTMFFRMSIKHSKRIKGYREKFRPVWHFFTLKAYCIMAVMMGGGIWLRSSGLVPDKFIAVFYTGLGCALALAGILFWIVYIRYDEAYAEGIE